MICLALGLLLANSLFLFALNNGFIHLRFKAQAIAALLLLALNLVACAFLGMVYFQLPRGLINQWGLGVSLGLLLFGAVLDLLALHSMLVSV